MKFAEVVKKKYGLTITSAMQKELDGFDQKVVYGGKHENLRMGQTSHKNLIGEASHLIKNMIEGNADEEETIRMLKYFAVVLDAVKYGLDYKQAANDFDFYELKQKYYRP